MESSNKMRLFVDMDGTLAKFSYVTNEEMHAKGYFENLEPIESVLSAVKNIQYEDNGIEVFTMSAYLTDSPYALDEKNRWLNKHFPEIDNVHRVFVPCGENKKNYIPDGVQESDHLLDDFTENLIAWLPNMGIKILNGINHTKGTWDGNMISYEKDPMQIAKNIVAVMHGEQIRDIAPLNYDGLDKEEWQGFLEKEEYQNRHRQNLLRGVKRYLNQGYDKEQVKYLAGCETRHIRLEGFDINKDMSLEELKSTVNEKVGVISFDELKDMDYAILDVETTGFRKEDEVIELGIIDKNGNRLYDGLLRPLDGHVNNGEAQLVNQIRNEELQNAPSMETEWERIKSAIGNRTMVTFNLDFDRRMMMQTAHMHGITEEESKSIWNGAKCIMQSYVEHKGEYRAIKLQDAIKDYGIDYVQTHRAVDDCLVTKQLIDAATNEVEKESISKMDNSKFTQEHAQQLSGIEMERNTIVINAFGGAGAGKTTACHNIIAELKKHGYIAEYVSEYAKELVWDKNWELLNGTEEHQREILKEQLHRMDRLMGKVDFIVTDAPVLLNQIYNNELTQDYADMTVDIFKQYENFCFVVQRDENSYEQEGRIQTFEEAKEKDNQIKDMLTENGIYFGTYRHDTIEKVVTNSIATKKRIDNARIEGDERGKTEQNHSQEDRAGLDEYRQQVKTIYDYEVENNVPENDRMTRWYDEMGIAVAKPWYKENAASVTDKAEGSRHIPISEMSIAERYSEIKRELETISKEQEEYFKDSVVRDTDGNLIKMYHGTPFDDFDYFRGGTHFTQDKEYAKNYENVGASSSGINNKKLMDGAKLNPATHEVFLNITKPFTLEDEACLDIYINEYIKGGNAQGINPYLDEEEYEKMFADNPVIDWNEADNLKEFLEENEYDYDGLIVDEGGTGGYSDEVLDRGKAYVIFHPEQVKLTSDRTPLPVKEFKVEKSISQERTTQDNMYRYYATQRPIDIGVIPRTSNAHVTNFDDRIMVEEIGRQAYGYVEYDAPLSEQEISNYELYEVPKEKEEVILDNEILTDAGVRPLKEEECYVYIVRKKSNGQYHIGWTQNLPEKLNQLKDKDKVLGNFIVPNKMTAVHFKNALNKQSHFNIDTMLLYPDRLEDMYVGHESVEYTDVTQLNTLANLDVSPIKRSFQFMRSENDLANELYNDSVTKLADAIQEKYLDDITVAPNALLEMADNVLSERVPVVEMALENGFSRKETEKLMTIDVSRSDYLSYTMEQAQDIVTNGADTIIEDEEKRLIPAGAFEDVVVSENDSVKYFKCGLKGQYFMQVTDSDNKATLYTLESFSVLPYVSQLVLGGYDETRTREVIDKFTGMDEQIEDDALAQNIVSFVRDASGQIVDEQQVVTMLKQADSAGLYKLIENRDLITSIMGEGIDGAIKINQLKGLIKHNAKAFDRKNLDQFITRAKEDIRVLENIPDYIRGNIESMRQITKEVKSSLAFLPDSAKSDLQCVLNAVENDGQDYVYADAALRENEDVIKAALKNDRRVASFISAENLEKVVSQSRMSVGNLKGLSVEECLAIYAYVEDDISLKAIGNYFDKHKDNKAREDAMFKRLEEKWNGEEEVVIKEPKTAILKLRDTKENASLMGYSLEELKAQGITPDISKYEIVYIKDGYVKSKEGINNLFRVVNGEEKPQSFYENAMEIGDIVVTTNDGFNYDSYFVDMENNRLDAGFMNLLTVRKINDNLDVRVERDILSRFSEENILDEAHAERLALLDSLYSEHILNAGERAGEVKEETSFELTKEEKDGLRKTDIAEKRQNILPKDRMTYKKEDGEVILKKDAVKSKEEFIQRTEELNQKEETIRNISLTYAIESSEDFTNMLSEYSSEDIKQGTNYRLVQIDKFSGKLVKANDLLFSSREVAERFFHEEINNSQTGNGKNVLVDYDVLVSKAFEVASIRKNNELLQGIQNVMDSEKFKGWCVARANQFEKKYSLKNSLSIFMQNPNASIVYGARQWQEYGRQVKKGEKAMTITIPYRMAFQNQKGGLMRVIEKEIQAQIAEGKEYGTYRLGDSNLTFIGNKTGLYSMLVNDQVVLSNVDSKSLSYHIDTNVIGKIPVAFTTCSVFDISQVEEPEYLSIRTLKEEDKKDLMVDENGKPQKTWGGAYKVKNTKERREKLNPVLDRHIEDAKQLNVEEIYKTLQLISERNGVPVSEANVQKETGARGYYSRTESKIVIDSTLSPTEKVTVCVHEIAHSRMHENGGNMPRRLKEVQAETVAYIVNKSLGIDTETSSFNYIANWMGSRKMSEIKQSLDLINNEANALYEDIKKDLDERGVSLKLEEYKKDKALESTKGQDKNAMLAEMQKLSVDYMELNAEIRRNADYAKEKMNSEKDEGILDARLTIVSTYQSIMDECGNINKMISSIRQEVEKKEPDMEKVEQNRQMISKAMERVEISRNEIYKLEEHISDIQEDKIAEMSAEMTEIERLREEFNKNSLDTLNQLKQHYTKLADLDKNQIQFLSISPFVKVGMESANDVKSFVDFCSLQAQNAEQVKSESNIFVEIVSSEYKDLEKGSLMHIKTADEAIATIEFGMRSMKEEALKHKELVPCVTVAVNVYGQSEKGNLISLSEMKLELGNGKQDGLMSAIESRTKNYSKYQGFVKSCKESCKEKHVEKEKMTPPVPNISHIIAHNNFLRESAEKEKESHKKEELKEVENHDVRDLNDSFVKDRAKEQEKGNKNAGDVEH